MSTDKINIDKINETEGGTPPKKTNDRTFFLVAGILGSIMIISLILMAVYAMMIVPNRKAADNTEIAEINLQNTRTAMDSQLTAVASKWTATPISTRTPDLSTATPRPTIVVEAVYTPTSATAKEDSLTATAVALLTQQAENSPTATPVSTLVIEATHTPTPAPTLATSATPTAAVTAEDMPQGEGYPTFAITVVSRNNNVSILTENLPADEDFIVTMGYMGTKGIGGHVVETTNSGAGGQLALSFSIPPALYNQYKISIRMVSIQTGYYAFNWFYNNDANVSESAPSVLPSTYDGYPTFSIVEVVEDTRVMIAGTNFPPNDTFLVRMNLMFTRGIVGVIVETVTTDADGILFDVKFDIPSLFYSLNRIAIRLESPTSGYYAYNWFYNNDAP